MSDAVPLRVAIVGALLGGRRGTVPSQSERLATGLRSEGYAVCTTSGQPAPALRALDTTYSLLRWGPGLDAAIVDVFDRRGFLMAALAGILLRPFGTPFAFVLRGGGLPRFATERPRLVARTLARATATVAPSGYLLEALGEWTPSPRIIPNILPLEGIAFREIENLRPKLLWMRTFEDTYRPEMALDALSLLVERGVDATLTYAGQAGEVLPRLEARVAREGLSERVRFAGFLDLDAKRAMLASHDLFLNTPRIDNTPVSLIEAAAAGLPIVSTRVGGIPHLFEDGVSALLVPDGDAAAMADAVARLLGDGALARSIALGGKAVAARCTWDCARPLWTALIDDLVASRG